MNASLTSTFLFQSTSCTIRIRKFLRVSISFLFGHSTTTTEALEMSLYVVAAGVGIFGHRGATMLKFPVVVSVRVLLVLL